MRSGKEHRQAPSACRLGPVLCVALALSTGAATAASLFDDNEARRQIGIEQQRIDDLRKDLKTQHQAIDARIGKLGEALKSQPMLDLFTQLEALKLEMTKLHGQIEVLNNNVENTAKRQRDMYLDLDTRMRRIEQQGVAAPAAAAPPPVPVSPPPAAAAPSAPAAKPGVAPPAPAPSVATVDGSAETRAYEAAQAQRRIGNYQGAIVAFQNFIKQYPKSSLAPRAQYWIGDSYFNLRDFKLAVASQQALISGYPDSPTVPDAMLNIASSQIEMGESTAGKKMLEELVAKYPISDAADKAKRRLASPGTPAAKP